MVKFNRSLIIDILYVIFSLILIALVLFWDKINLPLYNTTENFIASRNQDDFFGNLVAYKSSATGIATGTVIQLPGRVQITGINTTTFLSNRDIPIRIYIADNTTNSRSADTRTEIIDPRITGGTSSATSSSTSPPTLKSDIGYSDYLNIFEGRGYVGSAIFIEIPSQSTTDTNTLTTESDNNDNQDAVDRVLQSISIYGIPVNSLNKADYDKMPMITSINVNKTSSTYRVTFNNGNFKVGYIYIPGLTVHRTFAIQIQYSNSLDDNNAKFNIEGPNRLHWSDGHQYIYIAEPIIAQNIYISVPNNNLRSSIMNSLEEGVDVYGFPATDRDAINFKLRSSSGTGGGMGSARDKIGLVISGRKCPNVNEMMHKQLQAQQICEALEYKDKAKNKRIAYEKEKEFLKKLQTQDTEIKDLEAIIDRLMTRKQQRLESAEGHNMAEVDRELKHLSDLKKDVEQHLANTKAPTSGLNLAVDLHPK